MDDTEIVQNGDRVPDKSSGNTFYIDPSSQDHVEYFDHLRAFNSKVHRGLSADMASEFRGLSKNLAFTTTGSDARLEKGPVSPIEIILIAKDHNEYYAELSSSINDYLTQKRAHFHLDDLELKFLCDQPMVQWVLDRGSENESKILSPSRILDANFISGDIEIYNLAKKKAIEELSGKDGKYIAEKLRERTRQHRKISLTGLQSYRGHKLTHFDLESGIAYYNPKDYLYSFKQGPLRTVQNAIMAGIGYLSQDSARREILPNLPSNTVERLHSLEVEGMTKLNSEQVRELSDHYKFFLWVYHKSQHNYRTRNVTETGFDTNEAKQRVKALSDICAYGIVK